MALCEYEKNVLRRIRDDDRPDDPGAAWWAAVEALSVLGLIKDGKLTYDGALALS